MASPSFVLDVFAAAVSVGCFAAFLWHMSFRLRAIELELNRIQRVMFDVCAAYEQANIDLRTSLADFDGRFDSMCARLAALENRL